MEAPTAAPVLRLGDSRLRLKSRPVGDVDDPALRDQRARLHATLAAFRAEHGFGRAIAAPQIGVPRRFVALDLGQDPFTVIDPVITWRSAQTLTLWDDCMSFPDLLVRVRRHAAIELDHTDDEGARTTWRLEDPRLAELLQHELDHLDGVLAVDRALDADSLVTREAFEAEPERYAAQVDLKPRPSGPRPGR